MSSAKHRWFRYVPEGPPEGRSDPVDDFRGRWPLLGRIGYCADGADWRDAYILVVPVENTQVSWDVVVRGFSQETGAEEFVDEWLETEPVRSFLADNPVEWAPAALDGLIEARVFGWRTVQRLGALKRGAFRYSLGGLRFAPPTVSERRAAARWPLESTRLSDLTGWRGALRIACIADILGVATTDHISDLAASALVEGEDSPNLRLLAGLSAASDPDEVHEQSRRTMDEMFPEVNRSESVLRELLAEYLITGMIAHPSRVREFLVNLVFSVLQSSWDTSLFDSFAAFHGLEAELDRWPDDGSLEAEAARLAEEYLVSIGLVRDASDLVGADVKLVGLAHGFGYEGERWS